MDLVLRLETRARQLILQHKQLLEEQSKLRNLLAKQEEQILEEESSSDTEETYKVVLPSEIDGVNVTLSNYNPLPGEEVIIYVETTLASKRVDSVSVYGELLTAYNTSDSNTKIYKFIMKKQNKR